MAPSFAALAAFMLSTTAFAAALPRPVEQQAQIVGGEPAKARDFPYIVSLAADGVGHFCGGSLLDSTTVLTAAHCNIFDAKVVSVRAGSLQVASGGILVNVSRTISHPAYGYASGHDSDVAIYKLATPLPAEGEVGYAKLPVAGFDPAAGSETMVAGWGALSSGGASPPDLMKVSVPVISRDVCKQQYGDAIITNTMFCAGLEEGGKDSCQGDSGGPIIDMATESLIGAVSWGRGCALAGYAGVYSNVGLLLDFITANMEPVGDAK